jgi:hypothetical protein
MKHLDDSLSILKLPDIVMHLLEKAASPFLDELHGPVRPLVRYLRRKPGRGLAVIYTLDELKRHRKRSSTNLFHSVGLTLGEQALKGTSIRFSETQIQQAALAIPSSGILHAKEIDLVLQVFPADEPMPALTVCCNVIQQQQLFRDLQAAVQVLLNDQAWQIVDITALPVRYKPASRCVIRYALTLQHLTDKSLHTKSVSIFGKVYADGQQARAVQSLQQELYQEQMAKGELLGHTLDRPFLARPLGVNETLGLTFNEAVQPDNPDEPLRTGIHALRIQIKYGHGGEVTDIIVPNEELILTAIALARLHTSSVQPTQSTLRTGTKEAKRARERASQIAGWNLMHAEMVQALARQLARRLEAQQPDAYRPAHGGFKASQLLFHSQRVFVVDLDGFCLADAALDVGYFLAYLRPSQLWYARQGARQWFDASAKVFTTTYRQAMLELGITQAAVDGILERSRLYEAALLFKIATRRVNRLNSP